MRRRDVMWLGAGVAAAALRRPRAWAGAPRRPQSGAPREEDVTLPAGAVMPKRRLGRTGVEVSLLGLGGFHIGLPDDDQTATRIVRMAVDHGVTFLDNCWDYNQGKSQTRMGQALRDGYRRRVFLMTKIDGRTRQAAATQIDQCLRALQTDVIDLVQIHEVIRASDPGRVFGPDGAIEALVAARQAGKLRFIGFTGHKSPAIHLAMLRAADQHGFRFDTVQMPVNVMDASYDSFGAQVLPVLHEKEIGALAMKPLGSGLFLRTPPFTDGALTPTQALHYAMSRPTSVVITGCDTVGVLKQALAAAYAWKPALAREADLWAQRAAEAARDGKVERYKTTEDFDGTASHPWWLETASLAHA